MNTILQKRIEEAEREIVDEFTEQVDLSEFAKEYLQKLFLGKAKWLLSHQWISVDEELPDYRTIVLVTDSQHKDCCWFSHRVPALDTIVDEHHFVKVCPYQITHWMPIQTLEGGEE